METKIWLLLTIYFLLPCTSKAQVPYHEAYRPQVHFSPREKWMNDPNGMVFYKGTYHLFFQYYPGGINWGPMHWGHATSKDLIHWQQLPIALYPDKLGYIFSGSAVVDEHNTSGFGKNGQVPMVAIYTSHDPKGEKAGVNNFQNQSIAYSLDNGITWTKYSGNPVLKNPGIRDFRDPKVMWYAPGKKWVMTLATLDHITFFTSPDLKQWTKESEFGKGTGAHGGVWECPDLFPLQLDGKTYWILIGNLNPGGPNGGSATQYFVGQFNGHEFTPADRQLRWLDYGPDEYAGVIWNHTGERRIFLGWMSNWLYAGQLPTERWRNSMTIPRELRLTKQGGQLLLAAGPVKELAVIERKALNTTPGSGKNLLGTLRGHQQYEINIHLDKIDDYALTWSNKDGEKLVVGYRKATNTYFIDRHQSGNVSFNPDFAKLASAPRLTASPSADLVLVVDDSSVELFADKGLTVMTALFFPKDHYSNLTISNSRGLVVKRIALTPLKPIWP
jgi:fructan beta-fructosidase